LVDQIQSTLIIAHCRFMIIIVGVSGGGTGWGDIRLICAVLGSQAAEIWTGWGTTISRRLARTLTNTLKNYRACGAI
jgi:hypothetical protein